jgi:hypothetical protein
LSLYSLQLDSLLLFPFSLQKFELEVQRKKKQFEQVDLAELKDLLLEVAISSHNGRNRIVSIITPSSIQ